ncbi:hypothetical protein [Cyanothece sp. BG0011]|uniref:hypothetical protein n=1 Tax=Cyanothece sp. BG0011 TaxID=2082950 RepID=UPI0013005F7E|nr:hypothetical protein [Cyanothece sp. BG0011]
MTNNTELSKQLNLSISPELYELLEKLAKNNNTDIANIIINGIALFGIAEEEAKQKGYKLGIIDGDTVIKEIEIDLS